jgi:hypothetical protein
VTSSTAEAVVALGPLACRWPLGEPGRANFFFCGRPVGTKPPYCAVHRDRAFVAAADWRGSSVNRWRQGWRSPTKKRLLPPRLTIF